MADFIFPDENDLRIFVEILQKGNYAITKYLPPISEDWFSVVSACIAYVRDTSTYEPCSFVGCCSRLLYKIAKRHELGDGNKRSSVIGVYLFCLLNNYRITDPTTLKQQAKRVAMTKGRLNEELMRQRVTAVLETIIVPRP